MRDRLPKPSVAGVASVAGVTGAVLVVTALNGFGPVPLGHLAASERAVGEGRAWLLVSSAFVADRPAVPEIAGFALVGLAALALCGTRTLWVAAALGHIGGTVAVYSAIALARAADPSVATRVVSRADYGTSAIIAAWIGVIAYNVWRRGSGTAAVGLCIVSALVGWLFRPGVDVLDTEHLVALAAGIAVARLPAWKPAAPPPVIGGVPATWARLRRASGALQQGVPESPSRRRAPA